MVLDLIISYLTTVIQTTGYFGVFVLMVMESMIFPIPSEGVMPFAGILSAQNVFNLYLVTLISGIGSLVGSLLSYYIGKYGGLPFLEKYGKYFLLSQRDLEWSHKFFEKRGTSAIFISRFIPIVRHVISIPAGIAQMNIWKFCWATFIGATTWNFILAYFGFKAANSIHLLSEYSKIADGIVIILLVVGLAWYVDRHWSLRKKFWK